MRIKENELRNTRNQVDKYTKDITDMKKKLAQAQGVNKMLGLEEKLRDSKREKAELEKRIRELEMRQKEQGKQLDRLNNEEEFQQKLRGLVDELRVWREKVRKLNDQQEREE